MDRQVKTIEKQQELNQTLQSSGTEGAMTGDCVWHLNQNMIYIVRR